jgi:hypothetical protein
MLPLYLFREEPLLEGIGLPLIDLYRTYRPTEKDLNFPNLAFLYPEEFGIADLSAG